MKKFVIWTLAAVGVLGVFALVGYADQTYPLTYVDSKGKAFTAAEILVSTATANFTIKINEKLTKKQWMQALQESLTRGVLSAQRDSVAAEQLSITLKLLSPDAQNQQAAKK